jgi:hypothetical protein
MGITRTITLAAAPVGETLGLALVATGPTGARVLRATEAAGFDAAAPERFAAAVSGFLAGEPVDEAMLVAPAAWCALREIAVTPAEWPSARQGVLESLEDLLPLAAEEARVGVIGLYDENERCGRGALVAVRRDVIDPLVDALRQSTAGARVTVVSSHIAALGLDVQGAPRTSVVENDGAVDASLELAGGLPIHIDEPAPRSQTILRIGEDVSPADLAAAAPMASLAAPGAWAPMTGDAPNAWKRHLPAGAAIALAALLLAASPLIWNARLSAGAEAAEVRRVELREAFDRAQSARAEAERLTELSRAFDRATADWASVMPAVTQAVEALGAEGFIYRLQLERGVLTMTGESPAPGDALERLESARALSNARFTTPLTPSPTDPALRVFTIRAEVAR